MSQSEIRADIGPFRRPKFVWLKPCGPCPSAKGSDPETEDIATWPFFRRMRMAFPCAWRPEGYCAANYRKCLRGES